MNIFQKLLLSLMLKRPYRKYTISVCKEKEDFEEVYRLRYQIYCLTDKLLNKDDYPDGIEMDEFDKNSIQFIVRDSKNQTIGTTRVIVMDKNKLPTVKEFHLENSLYRIEDMKIGEISRFLIVPGYRKTILMIDLCKAIYQQSKAVGIEYWVGCVESWFLKGLNELFGPITVASEGKHTFNAINYPFILNIYEAEINTQKNRPMLFKYLKEEKRKLLYDWRNW